MLYIYQLTPQYGPTTVVMTLCDFGRSFLQVVTSSVPVSL